MELKSPFTDWSGCKAHEKVADLASEVHD